MQGTMPVRSAKRMQDALRVRKDAGLPRRGDPRAGRGKTPFGPKGGRNRGGRGKEQRVWGASEEQ